MKSNRTNTLQMKKKMPSEGLRLGCDSGSILCDITPITQMTWLKNLYMIFGDAGDAWKCTQALPDTHVVASGDATVGGGWRRLPNYYDMRDCLGMYYMN